MYTSIMFTHDDLDGAGCNVLFQLFNDLSKKGIEWNVINSSIQTLTDTIYQEIDNGNILAGYTDIYFADICPTRQFMDYLIQLGFRILVFDHHLTNEWVLENPKVEATVCYVTDLGVKESGTSLFYQYTVNKAMSESHEYFNEKMSNLLPEFVEVIRLYDTYEWKRNNDIRARELQVLFSMLGMETFCKRYVDKLMNQNEKELISDNDLDFVRARIKSEQRNIDRCTPDRVIDIEVNGRKIALLLGSFGANFSELSNQFLKKYPQYDATIDFTLFGNKGSFQIRGKGDIDLAHEIAKPIGGGGHPAACGAPFTNEYYDRLQKLILEALTTRINF